ncbi:hypothetical protein [Sphingomonas sp.]|uniref:hypothetical protein n=1 Tax=Sphingomonas sp. TaxID=28214 RepID=UPI0025F87B38|nr:hypothetical protein [Sphingomonas sp.]
MGLKRSTLFAAIIAACATLWSAPAAAQATRTWISGVGDDANPCSRTAPCKTFAGAISKTAAGGEINCLDPGGFGAVTITKSISLICDKTEAGVVVAGSSAIVINSASAYVVIDGLDLEGLGNAPTTAGINGVYVINAAAVHVRNTKIRGFRNGYGINFAPQSGNSQLFVDNVTISESGGTASPTSTGGITVNPAAGITASATITNSNVVDNMNIGIRADTTGIVGSVINLSIDRVTVSNNGAGILAKAPNGTGTVKLMLTDSQITLNAGQGLIANGTAASANAFVGNTTITNNGTGILVLSAAKVLSYGNNRLDGNTTDGAFTGTIPLH